MQANKGRRRMIGILTHVATFGSFEVASIIGAKVASH
jgi:hypothetical protein